MPKISYAAGLRFGRWHVLRMIDGRQGAAAIHEGPFRSKAEAERSARGWNSMFQEALA